MAWKVFYKGKFVDYAAARCRTMARFLIWKWMSPIYPLGLKFSDFTAIGLFEE